MLLYQVAYPLVNLTVREFFHPILDTEENGGQIVEIQVQQVLCHYVQVKVVSMHELTSVAVLSLRPRLEALCPACGLPLSGLLRPFLVLLLSESDVDLSEFSFGGTFGAKLELEVELDGCG